MYVFKWVLDQNGNVLTTCGRGVEADFWFMTRHVDINITLAEVIYVEVEAGFRLCYDFENGEVPCYSNYFQVYIYAGKYILDIKNVRSYFKPSYNITTDISPTKTLTKTIHTFLLNSQYYSQVVTFAFRSRGACGSIFRTKMYYYYCEETFNKGIKFEETPSPAEGFKNVTGNCSENSVPSTGHTLTSVNRYCYPNGTWSKVENDKNLECYCVEGYEPVTDGTCASEFHARFT